jgi:hypothetical protein
MSSSTNVVILSLAEGSIQFPLYQDSRIYHIRSIDKVEITGRFIGIQGDLYLFQDGDSKKAILAEEVETIYEKTSRYATPDEIAIALSQWDK